MSSAVGGHKLHVDSIHTPWAQTEARSICGSYQYTKMEKGAGLGPAPAYEAGQAALVDHRRRAADRATDSDLSEKHPTAVRVFCNAR